MSSRKPSPTRIAQRYLTARRQVWYHCGRLKPGDHFDLAHVGTGESYGTDKGFYFASKPEVAKVYCQYADDPYLTEVEILGRLTPAGEAPEPGDVGKVWTFNTGPFKPFSEAVVHDPRHIRILGRTKMAATTPVPASFPPTEIGLMTMDEFLEYRNPKNKHHDADIWDYTITKLNRDTERSVSDLLGGNFTVSQMANGYKITNRRTGDLEGIIHNGVAYYDDTSGDWNYRKTLKQVAEGVPIDSYKQVKYLDELMPLISPLAKINAKRYPVVLQRLIVGGEPMSIRAEKQPTPGDGTTLAILNSEGLIVAMASDEWGATLLTVVREYRGKGLGKILGKRWYKLNPHHTSGGFTSAGRENALALWRDRVREFKARGWYSQLVRSGRLSMEKVQQILSDVGESKRDLQEWANLYFDTEQEETPIKPTGDILVYSDGDSTFVVYDRAFLDQPDERFIHGYGFFRDSSNIGTFIYSIDYDRPFADFTTKVALQMAKDNGEMLYDGEGYSDFLEVDGIPGVVREGDYIKVTQDLVPNLRQLTRREQKLRKAVDPYDEKYVLLLEMGDSKWR